MTLSLLKSHAQLVIPVPVEVSVNCTVSGAAPEVGVAVKLATGAGTCWSSMITDADALLSDGSGSDVDELAMLAIFVLLPVVVNEVTADIWALWSFSSVGISH